MKHRILIAFLLIVGFTSCNKPNHFTKDQLRKALFTCLSNNDLKGWVFSDSLINKRTHIKLYGNVAFNDSMKIDKRIYDICKGTGNISRDTAFIYRLHYKTERIATIHLIYQPGTSFRIYSYCDFVFDKDEWQPQHQTTGIMDGRFKL